MLENEEEALGTIRKARVMSKEKLYDLVALKQKIKGLTGEERRLPRRNITRLLSLITKSPYPLQRLKNLKSLILEMQGKLKIARAVVAEGLEVS